MLARLPDFTPVALKSAIVRNPLVVSPQITVMEAIALMSEARSRCQTHPTTDSQRSDFYLEARSSCVLVVEDDRLVGILTERDVVRLSAQGQSLDIAIDRVMASPLVTLRQSDFSDVFVAVNLLQHYQIRHLPILDDGDCLVGLVTHESLRQAARPGDLLRLRLVADVMTREVVWATPDASMLEIARKMSQHRVSSVILVEPGGSESLLIPVGILTERDLVQFRALGSSLENITADPVMSTPVFSVKPEESLQIVQRIVEQRYIRRVVVTGKRGELLGIVTQTSLLKAFNPIELYHLAKGLEEKVVRLEAEKMALLESRNIELERQVAERTTALQTQAERDRLLTELASQIRSSLSLQTILDTTVEQVWQVLRCDRVNIWRFEADWQTVVVAESTDSSVSLIGERIDDTCFKQDQAEVYRQGRVRVVSDIYTTEMSDCHRELLVRIQTRAKILIPLLCGDRLWGLLNASESEHPRDWQPEEVELLEALSVQLAIALGQATTYEQLAQELLERQQAQARLRESERQLQQLNQQLEAKVAQRTAALQEREQFLQTVLDAFPLSVFWKDRNSVYLGCNRNFLRDAGLTSMEEIIGKTDYDLPWAQTEAHAYRTDDRQVIDSGTAKLGIIETQIPADGNQTWLDTNKIPLQNLTGEIIGVLGTYRDITDRQQTALRLRQQAERERLLDAITQQMRSSLKLDDILNTTVEEVHRVLQSDRMLIYRVFPEGTGAAIAESVSPQWPKILDRVFPEEVFPKQNYERYVKGRIFALRDRHDENESLLPCLVEFLGELQVRAKLVVPIVRDRTLWGLLIAHQCDRPRQWQQWEIDLLQQVADRLAIAIQQAGLFEQLQQQLAQRQQAQQQLTERNQQLAVSNYELARATRLKDEFLANMSHELRTPLNAILGMAEGLQEQVFGPLNDRQIKALETIDRSASHLLELINDILDVAKIESGQLNLDVAPTAIAPLCQSSLVFVKQQAHKKCIQLDIKLPLELPDLLLDERRIRQVLINLLGNAVKFTPEGGCIALEVSRPKPLLEADAVNSPPQYFLKIAVRDTGIGIASEHLDRLFEPFIQIDSALNRKYQGTGLGLSLVKRIVELHGGQVEVTSKVGVGSCFTIALPCAAIVPASDSGDAQPKPQIDTHSPIPEASPLILLAEDNEANISTLSSYLKAKGYRLVLAKNGEEAIAQTKSERPDLILMDVQMPGTEGIEAMAQIRREPDFADVPIVALTALAMAGDRDRCLAAGASDYFTKPVKLKQLVATIQQLLVTPTETHR